MGTGDTGYAPSLGSTSSKDGKEGKKGSCQHGSKATAISQRQPKFEGKCDELKGHIFDCSDVRQADLFAKSCKEIAKHVGRNYKYGGDARLKTLPALSYLNQKTHLKKQVLPRNGSGKNR